MSLYIGDNNSGKKILHMTKNQHTENELKNGILPDTTFHSNLNYLRVKRLGTYSTYTIYEHVPWNNILNAITVIKLSNADIDFINKNKLGYGFIHNGVVVPYVLNPYSYGSQFKAGHAGNFVQSLTPRPSYTNNIISVENGAEGIYQLIAFNINSSSIIDEDFINPNDGTISISGSDIIIKGTSLLDFDYVSTERLNSDDVLFKTSYRGGLTYDKVSQRYYYPTIFTPNSYTYLVSPSVSGGNMNFTSTEIKKGNKILFSANVPARKIFFSHVEIKYCGPYTSPNKVLLTDNSFEDGEIFMIMGLWDADERYGQYFFPLRFRNGRIHDVGPITGFFVATFFGVLEGINNMLYFSLNIVGASTPTIKARILRFHT